MSASATTSEAGTRPGLAWTEIGQFVEALTFARRVLMTPVDEINADYALGQRGIWVIGLIASGRIRTHSDLSRHFGIPKSVVTEQVALLVSQGLIATAQDIADKRQKTLTLTASGHALNDRLGTAFEAKFDLLLARFSAEDVRFCTKLLTALAGSEDPQP